MPFGGVDSPEAEARYVREEFPSLEGNPARDIIWGCWLEEGSASSEVLNALEDLFLSHQDGSSTPWWIAIVCISPQSLDMNPLPNIFFILAAEET